jgi:hypothetical protein
MQEIWQSATGISILLGPFLDKTDGITPETGIDLTTADSAIVLKHGVSASLALTSATWTDVTSGWYALNATSTMFDTLGQCTVRIQDVSICLPLWKDFMVIPTSVWNVKYGTTKLTIASVSNTVNCFATSIIGATIASVSNSVNFTVGTIASVSNFANWAISVTGSTYQIASSLWGKISYQPSSTVGDWTIASVTGSVRALASSNCGKTSYLPSATMQNWTIASVDNGVGIEASDVWSELAVNNDDVGSMGELLGAAGAAADPWNSTVTAYTGTNTFGLILGGIPSATTLASVVAAVSGKTYYLPSATLGEAGALLRSGQNTYASLSITGNLTGNIIGTLASVSVDAEVATETAAIYGKLPSKYYLTGSDNATGDVEMDDATGNYPGLLTGTLASCSQIGAFTGTVASVSSSVLVRGFSTGAVTASAFAAGALISDTEMASIVWDAGTSDWAAAGSMGEALGDAGGAADPWNSTVTAYTGTNTFGLILGGLPTATQLADDIKAVLAAAGGDPWSATVTGYTGTNTYGLILGGIPSATTLASVVAGVAGKTSYLPSVTVGSWSISGVASVSIGGTMASVSGSLWGMASSNFGKLSYFPSITIGSWSISGVASVSIGGTVASVSGSLWGMASSNFGKISYLPSITVGSWSISGVASVSIGGTVASVSGSLWGMASSMYGRIDYLPSITVGSWSISGVASVSIGGTIASVSGSIWGMASAMYGKIDYLPSLTVASWTIGLVGSVSASVVDAILDEVVDGTTTLRQSLTILNSFVAGKVSGGGTATITFRDLADGKNRIIMTVDASGNRSGVVLDTTI